MGKRGIIVQPSPEEAIEVLQAGYDIGFRRVHYTGGEPTVCGDFVDLLRAGKAIGHERQARPPTYTPSTAPGWPPAAWCRRCCGTGSAASPLAPATAG
ncbi:hypothetical protein ACIRRH_31955 [Kitasatospora sp. NPDC101235]|uniref:hypothetical protein n=1 Tax=Kitasatospora sp. NPDC101235 TaxID=3364101 RepID=UPI0037F17DE0